MSSELVARAVLHRIADAQPEITLEDGAAVVTESVAIRAMEDFAERAFSDVETLRDRLEALEAENARLREALEPFAGIAELVDLETEGLSDTDTFDLMFHDYLLDRFTLAHFRAARRAREGGNADG